MNAPGIGAVPRDEYDRLARVNWSKLKLLGKSPAHYRQELLHPSPDTDARKRGRAVHCATFEPERYAAQYVVWDGRRAGKEWETFRDGHEAKGREVLTEGMDEAARTIAAAARACAAAAPHLQGGKGEQTMLWTHEVAPLGGMSGYRFDCKGRPDFLSAAGAIVDLKTTRDASPDGFARQVLQYGYHAQAAMYVDGFVAATGGPAPRFVIVAVEAVAPYAVTVFRIPDEVLRLGREHYRGLFDRLHHCTENSVWPAYADAELDLALPEWGGEEVTEDDPTGLDLAIGG